MDDAAQAAVSDPRGVEWERAAMRGQGRETTGPGRNAAPTGQFFSTDAVPEADRLPLLQAVTDEILIGAIEMGRLPETRAFKVEVEAAAVGGLRLNHTVNHGLSNVRQASQLKDDVDEVTLILGTAGEGQIEHNGRRSRIRPGEVCILDLARPLVSRWDSCETLVVQLPRSIVADADLAAVAGETLDSRLPVVPLLQVYARTAFREARGRGSLPAMAERHLNELASALCRAGAGRSGHARSEVRDGSNAARLAALREAMLRTYLNPVLTMRHVAASVGLSERSGYLLFEQAGLSFTQELQALRLDRARERLVEGNERVIDVAYAVGFSDASHFHRLFKRRFNMTPGETRDQASVSARGEI